MPLDLSPDHAIAVDVLDKFYEFADPNIQYGMNYFNLIDGDLKSLDHFIQSFTDILNKQLLPLQLDTLSSDEESFITAINHLSDSRIIDLYINENLYPTLKEFPTGPAQEMNSTLFYKFKPPTEGGTAGQLTQNIYSLNNIITFKMVELYTTLPVPRTQSLSLRSKTLDRTETSHNGEIALEFMGIYNEYHHALCLTIISWHLPTGNDNITSFTITITIKIRYVDGQSRQHIIRPREYYGLELPFKAI